jgi:hypothetical protein
LLDIQIEKEKRKIEEYETHTGKRVKAEGDAPEALVKQLVRDVEERLANVQNEVDVQNFTTKIFKRAN